MKPILCLIAGLVPCSQCNPPLGCLSRGRGTDTYMAPMSNTCTYHNDQYTQGSIIPPFRCNACVTGKKRSCTNYYQPSGENTMKKQACLITAILGLLAFHHFNPDTVRIQEAQAAGNPMNCVSHTFTRTVTPFAGRRWHKGKFTNSCGHSVSVRWLQNDSRGCSASNISTNSTYPTEHQLSAGVTAHISWCVDWADSNRNKASGYKSCYESNQPTGC